MSYSRRTFLVGTASGLSVLALAACADDTPAPTPTSTPTSAIDEVPIATSFLRSNWAKDPYARGATSFVSVGALPQAFETLRAPLLNRVFLAGDATSAAPGTVHGAIAAGRAAAFDLVGVMADGERVAVIGAGAAGAAAARALTANGADVTVIEARDRTGGRIDSRVIDDDTYLELGAWRLTPDEDGSTIDALEREGVAVEPLTGVTAFAPDQGEAAQLDADDPALTAARGSLAAAEAWALQQEADVSVADAVREGGTPGDWPAAGESAVTSELLVDKLLLAASGLSGASADELSAWFSTPAPAAETVVPLGPLSSFIDATLDGIEVAVSTAVVGVFYDESGVSLRLATGESLSVDRVVVTVPLGVLQEQVIEFDPPLPVTHRAALNTLSVGHIEVVRMEFESAFWTTDATYWVYEGDESIRLWVNLLPATGHPVLLGVVGGQSALALTDLDDAALRESARRSLAPFARSGI
jgi:monoamine oxidase